MKQVPLGWRRKSSPESASWVRESSFARDFMSPASTPRPLCGARRRWECSQAPGIRCMRRWRPVLSFSSTCCCDHWFGSSTGSRSRRPKPTFTIASASSAEIRKRRMSARCCCKAPAMVSSVCGGSTALTSMRVGASKSSPSSRLFRRATPFLSKWWAVSVLKQPFRPRAGASGQPLNSSRQQSDQRNGERDEADYHNWKHYVGCSCNLSFRGRGRLAGEHANQDAGPCRGLRLDRVLCRRAGRLRPRRLWSWHQCYCFTGGIFSSQRHGHDEGVSGWLQDLVAQ